MRLKKTFLDRANTNAEVYRQANEHIEEEAPPGKIPKLITPFTTAHKNARIERFNRILNMQNDNPAKQSAFQNQTIKPWVPPCRRVGRPKYHWVTETAKEIWDNIKPTLPPTQTNAF